MRPSIKKTTMAAFAVLIWVASTSPVSASDPIILDSSFGDWAGEGNITDPTGDTSKHDITQFWWADNQGESYAYWRVDRASDTTTVTYIVYVDANNNGTFTENVDRGVVVDYTFPPMIMTPHSESTSISGTNYYDLKGDTPADGAAMTETTPGIDVEQTGRWIMHNSADSSREARHVFPLTGMSKIDASTWTVYYRGRTSGDPNFPKPGQDNDVNFNIDILIRQSDGTVRATLATEVAKAFILSAEAGQWVTKSATYAFPEYVIVDDTDYLEIDYYGSVDVKGPGDDIGYIEVTVDDNTLAETDQTRIEGISFTPTVDSDVDVTVRYADTDATISQLTDQDWGESTAEGGKSVEFRVSFADLGITVNQTIRMYVESFDGGTLQDQAPDTGDIQWSPVNILGYALLGVLMLAGILLIWRFRGRYAWKRA